MIIELEFAEVHSPLFIKTGEKTGKNLGQKLSGNHHKGLTLAYDREAGELLVTYEGREAIVPMQNVACMWPAAERPAAKPAEEAKAPGKPIEAQVSTPQSHVHAGPGHGKTK